MENTSFAYGVLFSQRMAADLQLRMTSNTQIAKNDCYNSRTLGA